MTDLFAPLLSFSELTEEDVRDMVKNKLHAINIENAKEYYMKGVKFQGELKYQEAIEC